MPRQLRLPSHRGSIARRCRNRGTTDRMVPRLQPVPAPFRCSPTAMTSCNPPESIPLADKLNKTVDFTLPFRPLMILAQPAAITCRYCAWRRSQTKKGKHGQQQLRPALCARLHRRPIDALRLRARVAIGRHCRAVGRRNHVPPPARNAPPEAINATLIRVRSTGHSFRHPTQAMPSATLPPLPGSPLQ